MTQITQRNRLAAETSPYLRQHAGNPVDWYPWGEEALALAKRQDKPILLSIGYSACHWCHVMAHESFEDEDTARVMNDLFVNVKVDREERPDLDKIYQLSHQLLTRRGGGWPLTVFISPHDQVPFFSGTYFPKEARYNLPGFVSLLQQVSRYYSEQKDAVANNGAAFREVLERVAADEGGAERAELNASLPQKLLRASDASFDRVNGGFGGAPKFPHPSTLEFLLRQAAAGQASARTMLVLTLDKMAAGGIYDQIGGGFCRYAVDGEWQIPHFEKMLYDNGPLLALYAEAWQLTGAGNLRRVAEETAEWAIAEMQSAEGGYFSSLDADSEGEEGKFYVWDRGAVKGALSAEEYALLALHYGLNETPNFEGHWHLHVEVPLEAVAERQGLSMERAQELLAAAKAKLMQIRSGRVRPGLDDKILTSWNALMIKGMVVAGSALQREDFIDSAQRAFDFAHSRLWREGRLLATCKDGQARHPAYLDDYAFLIDAGIELLQSRWRTEHLHWITQLADDLLERFEDKGQGGFYFTAHDHESLIHRPRPLGDESMPSGNGVAAGALARLGHLVGDVRYLEASERVLKCAAASMQRHPQSHASLFLALEEWLHPPRLVIVRGGEDEGRKWMEAAKSGYRPDTLCFVIPPEATDLPGTLADRHFPGESVAYVCEGGTCLPPLRSPRELSNLERTAS